MTSHFIRILACATMLCDHIGFSMMMYGVGSGELAEVLRIIGRLSMPLFAFLIAEGFKKTHNVFLYMLRLLIAALISEIPYNLLTSGSLKNPASQNALFSLLIGLITVYAVDFLTRKVKSKYLKCYAFVPVFLLCYLAKRLSVDYGFAVVLLILLFYYLDNSSFEQKIWYLPALALFASRDMISAFWNGGSIGTWSWIQLFEIFCIVPILAYNGKKGYTPRSKGGRALLRIGFYLFYPVHMLVLYLVFQGWDKLLSLLA